MSEVNISNEEIDDDKESVYESEVDLMNDINRLIKLKDFDGIKLRV